MSRQENDDSISNQMQLKYTDTDGKVDLNRSRDLGTSNSVRSNTSSNKAYKWHLWWDGQQSDVKVPNYGLPNLANLKSKVGSLENLRHKPGGGTKKIYNELINLNKTARIDHINKGYKRSGGNKKIFNEKPIWNVTSQIKSLENYSHVPGGGDKKITNSTVSFKDVRPRIDSGFIYEQFIADSNYKLHNRLPPIPTMNKKSN